MAQPAAGMNPTKEPIRELRTIVGASCLVLPLDQRLPCRAAVGSSTMVEPAPDMSLSTRTNTWEMENRPIRMGVESKPSSNHSWPKVNRDTPAMESMPTVPIKRPSRAAKIPLALFSPVRPETTRMPKQATRKYSRQENIMLIRPRMVAKRIRQMAPTTPPNTEATVTMEMASMPWPCLVSS